MTNFGPGQLGPCSNYRRSYYSRLVVAMVADGGAAVGVGGVLVEVDEAAAANFDRAAVARLMTIDDYWPT